MTILTMLSTPILTSIFGDGSLEVCKRPINPNFSKMEFSLNQGEDTEDWANDDVVAGVEEEKVTYKC